METNIIDKYKVQDGRGKVNMALRFNSPSSVKRSNLHTVHILATDNLLSCKLFPKNKKKI